MDCKNARKEIYTYSRLVDAKSGVPGRIHNVIGVVKFIKTPVKTRGTDYVQVLSIVDESLLAGNKLVVSLFYKTIHPFPPASVGDVIRLHRIRVDKVKDELKGCSSAGFSWLVVHDNVDQPTVSSEIYSYTNEQKKRVQKTVPPLLQTS